MRSGVRWALAQGIVAIAAEPERIVPRFVDVPRGAFVWTRDDDGWYWLGRITGEARAIESPVGLPHVRDTQWLDRPLPGEAVPAGVAATFARGGRNFQRTHGEATERRTAELWDQAESSSSSVSRTP